MLCKGMDGTHSHPSLYEKKKEKWNFIFPRVSDYSVVDKTDIIVNLLPPKKIGETSRFMEYFSFDVHTSKYSVR